MNSRESSHRESERGIALLLTLLVLTILIIIVVQLAYSTKIGLGVARDRKNEMQIDMACRGIVWKAQAILRFDAAQGETDSKQDEWRAADFSDPGEATSSESEERVAEDVGEKEELKLRAKIVDEDSKFNLVHLLPRRPNPEKAADEEADASRNRNRRRNEQNSDEPNAEVSEKPRDKPFDEHKEKERHKRAIGILASILDEFRQGTDYDLSSSDARDLAEAIDAYVNRGENSRGAGASERSLTKSRMPMSIDELMMIEGVTEMLLYDFRHPDDDTEIVPGLYNFITVWSSGRVNINTAEEVVLRALFDEAHRDKAHEITIARGDEEDQKESDRMARLSPQERHEERERKRIEERRKRKRAAKGGDLFGDAGSGDSKDGDKNAEENGPFEQVSDLQKKNVVTNEDYQKILPYIGVGSQVFSVFVDAQKGHTKKFQRIVLRRLPDGKLATILWETRRNQRLIGIAEEEEEESLF